MGDEQAGSCTAFTPRLAGFDSLIPHQMKKPSCNFCGKSQREVGRLIPGPTVYICDECVVLCFQIIKEERPDWLANQLKI